MDDAESRLPGAHASNKLERPDVWGGELGKGGCEICCMQLVSASPARPFPRCVVAPGPGRRGENQVHELIP